MNIGVVLTLVGAVFASTGFWTFINNRLQRRDKKEDDKSDLAKWQESADNYHKEVKESIDKFNVQMDLQSSMLMGLGHDRIIEMGERYIDQGFITLEQYEDLDKYLYQPYHALGGNGTAEKIMDEIRKLPCVPEIKKEEDR